MNITIEIKQRIIADYQAGKTTRDIAQSIGSNSTAISRMLKQWGIQARPKGRRITTGDRTCTYCKEEKPIEEFVKDRKQARGHGWTCKRCLVTLSGIRTMKSKYDMTPADYESMLRQQNGKCAICGTIAAYPEKLERRLHIDHCHATGHVRGLLCSRCNTGIGVFQDNPELLRKAIEYLNSTYNTEQPCPKSVKVQNIDNH